MFSKIEDGKIVMRLYDKKNAFKFDVVSYPDVDGMVHYKRSHGVIIGEILRFAKICSEKEPFTLRAKALTTKLILILIIRTQLKRMILCNLKK